MTPEQALEVLERATVLIDNGVEVWKNHSGPQYKEARQLRREYKVAIWALRKRIQQQES